MDMDRKTDGLIRGWPILLALHYAGEIALHIRLQKLLFLMFSEAKMQLPYNFTKHEFGPYDPDIKIDFMELENQGYMNVKCVSKSERSYSIFSITKKGEEYVARMLLRTIGQRDLKRIEAVVAKYKNEDWKKVVSLVYERFNMERPELERKRAEIRKELFRLRPLWEAHYQKNYCEHVFTSLALIDHSIVMLGKKRFDSLDITQYNVLVSFLEEVVNYLKKETSSFSPCSEASGCQKTEDIEELYNFIQYLGEKYKILPSTCNEDADLDDFEFELGDKLRITKKPS